MEKDILLNDLLTAYYEAKRHKNNKPYVVNFTKKLNDNLQILCDSLIDNTYKPLPSACFIINHPKKREIFAASFQDRIVHHLIYDYIYDIAVKSFIVDSYSCIKGRGTSFGIDRLRKHIRQESENYTKECYALKMDIKGYFIHINRQKLFDLTKNLINKYKYRKDKNGIKYENKFDVDFTINVLEKIIMTDPTKDCSIKCKKTEWIGLPKSKSLFHTNDGCGLPIGNLTSQLLSNVYLNELDQFIKRELKCKHYGRYVDDFFIISKDKIFLHEIIPKIKQFLKENLMLDINDGKTHIVNVKHGVEFLGAFVKPNRTYISNKTISRIKNKLFTSQKFGFKKNPTNSINSYLGVFRQHSSFKLRKTILKEITKLYEFGMFNKKYTKFIPYEKL